ncbi:DUF1192 domain-containing protein [Brucella intermedia]|jgi:uncharacterized small protein (DUF1192 family)|uniref:DUF1192 domain-containing protein n=1 Tax=Brucella TaxID=234 RepID=UPI0007C3B5D0|nr:MULTISPECIES: DUF1192 domain-containing protein [Brucella/Ochrobactrum group]PJT20690.1 DUF1192 domain-containing protein [Ochrobactrum sp. 30A/1000/2015]PJT39987.1 DUF1192 domain-containing protein [Ochrobactrum sp. 27A/999/2015]PJT43451.1 DUF1192 domain-containing protein [Ochrobactrum sp. 23A/997/2015]KAB2708186.1 DUF1192 domain-containing protein [Brucella intermedia]MBA8845152.1 uncharacterized small protein (DUF1192 family) [Ochrobactrum sp. RH1CCR137]
MSGFDEDVAKPRCSVALSQEELSLLSVTEIDQRIALLQSEIERLKAERLKKGDSRAAAEALFR